MSIEGAPGARPILEVQNLVISYRSEDRQDEVVHGISFSIAPGEVVALVGESGSGKTTTAQAVIGLLAANGQRDEGSIRLEDVDIAHWSQKRLDSIRGARISLIPQDPSSSLNPVMTIGAQVAEIFSIHDRLPKEDVKSRVIELLRRVGLSRPELRFNQYPHQLSGGMRQRVLIAIAVALKPALIVADEPTSALDVTVQKRILDLIDELRRESATAVLFVTHDLGIAADRADRLIVLQDGHIREQGKTRDVLANPRHSYTKQLLSDVPSAEKSRAARPANPSRVSSENIIVVENLVQEFGEGAKHILVRAVDGVSFVVKRGTTHAIVGESGSGKTTTVRNIVGFQRPTAGSIRVDDTDITALKGEALRQFRRKIQLVYQNPFGSLDPRQTVFQIIQEPLLNFGKVGRKERSRIVHAILERVKLPPSALTRTPDALSGGQRQRVAIARALVLEPQILVLDEAVSALDVTVQAQILNLLDELQRALGLTYLFVSHDLAVVRQISDTVSVLQNGRLVESGPVAEVFANPASAYTRELIDAIPADLLSCRTQRHGRTWRTPC